MANRSFLIQDRVRWHFKDNKGSYCLVLFVAILGIIIGVYLSVTGYRYTSLLTASDKNMFDYITGTASYTSIFYSRLIDILICSVILVVLNLCIYTSFLSFMFLGYQMALIVLSSSAIISLYGLAGIINVVLFVVPINILNFIVMAVIVCLGVERARLQNTYKLKFFESFKQTSFIKGVLICFLIELVICILHSFILPLFIKSFVVFSY